jgi:hypothetical protein
MSINESPLFLLCDTKKKKNQKDFPVFIYETVIEYSTQGDVIKFAPLDYVVESVESERITVETINKLELASSTTSSSCKKELFF